MAHDAVDTCIRSRRLNGVTDTAIDKTGQNKPNGKELSAESTTSSNSSPSECTEIKNTATNTIHNYRRQAETCNGNATPVATATATAANHMSCMRGSLLHDNVPFIPQFRWPDLIVQICLHVGALYGLLFQFYSIKFYTLIWCKLDCVTNCTNERNDSNNNNINNHSCNTRAHFHCKL